MKKKIFLVPIFPIYFVKKEEVLLSEDGTGFLRAVGTIERGLRNSRGFFFFLFWGLKRGSVGPIFITWTCQSALLQLRRGLV